MSVAIQLRLIHKKVQQAAKVSGRGSQDIKIIAVSKKISSEKIREAYALGVRDFAENYLQEGLSKKSQLRDLEINWHFIGHLQSNKIKSMAGEFHLVHSLDRIKIAEEMSVRSSLSQDVLVEVNLAGEHSKSGCSEAVLPMLLEKIQSLNNLHLRGLMFMPPLDLPSDQSRNFYAQARSLRDRCEKAVSAPHSLLELSMGTSHDFEVAIEAGATMIRLGTVLFGPREK